MSRSTFKPWDPPLGGTRRLIAVGQPPRPKMVVEEHDDEPAPTKERTADDERKARNRRRNLRAKLATAPRSSVPSSRVPNIKTAKHLRALAAIEFPGDSPIAMLHRATFADLAREENAALSHRERGRRRVERDEALVKRTRETIAECMEAKREAA